MDRVTRGQRWADRVAALLGSWRFIIGQSFVMAGWITLNLIGFVRHWDPYPFILLNLMLSTQASFAAPVLQLASNRQTENDRELSEHIEDVTERIEAQNEATIAWLSRIHYLLVENQLGKHDDQGH